ncbi:MAG TPA: hypothetical protein VFK85_01360 [Anaeromyxobacteraceae bacterium]|nr:hypothetical protein [Anaeromyxobacteraceae bacterium]
MTTATTAPLFRTHSTVRATIRGAALVTLVATMLFGFVAQVQHGPSAYELRAMSASADARA